MHLFCHEQSRDPDRGDRRRRRAARQGRARPIAVLSRWGRPARRSRRHPLAGRRGEGRGFRVSAGKLWHLLDTPERTRRAAVEAAVDPDFRRMMRQLHTDTHILNALVFQSFDGALVTGVQMADDGTARMDFDVPGRRQRSPARARRPDQRPDPPGYRGELRLCADGRGAGRARPDPQPLGRAAAHAGRQDPHRRDRRASIARPAAARISPRPAHRRRSASSRSTTRAVTTAASGSAWLSAESLPKPKNLTSHTICCPMLQESRICC